MAFPQGIAFRATAGYVTDGANDYGEVHATANYPTTTPQGNNVGWEQAITGQADRNNAIDVRLAGVEYVLSAQADYRIDLPATGSYNIRVAGGDASSSNITHLDLYDTTSTLGTLTNTTPATGSFADATNTVYSAANWPGSNAAVAKTFTTTICRFRFVNVGTYNVASYLYVEAAAGGSFQSAWARNANSIIGAGGTA